MRISFCSSEDLLFRKASWIATNELMSQEGEFTTIAQTLDTMRTKAENEYDIIEEQL